MDLDIGEEQGGASPQADDRKEAEAEAPRPKPKPKPQAKPAPIDKEKQKTVRRWERKVEEAETRVAEMEGRLAAMAQELAAMDPTDWKAFNERLEVQKGLETELAYAMAEWEEAPDGPGGSARAEGLTGSSPGHQA